MALQYDEHIKPEADGFSPSSKQTTLILLHGGALSSRMYRTAIPALFKKGYTRIICPDLPGHGKSQRLGPFTVERSTQLLYQLLPTLKGTGASVQSEKFLLVRISLGGQAVLDLLAHHPEIFDAAIVCGVSVRPPDESAQWEMPRMPGEKEWMDVMMEDVGIVGMDEAQAIQKQSLAFSFDPDPSHSMPPVLVNTGEHDIAMAKRDASFLLQKLGERNELCEMSVLEEAWHNHSIDVPERFAEMIEDWDKRVLHSR